MPVCISGLDQWTSLFTVEGDGRVFSLRVNASTESDRMAAKVAEFRTSLDGYGFSQKYDAPGWGEERRDEQGRTLREIARENKGFLTELFARAGIGIKKTNDWVVALEDHGDADRAMQALGWPENMRQQILQEQARHPG